MCAVRDDGLNFSVISRNGIIHAKGRVVVLRQEWECVSEASTEDNMVHTGDDLE